MCFLCLAWLLLHCFFVLLLINQSCIINSSLRSTNPSPPNYFVITTAARHMPQVNGMPFSRHLSFHRFRQSA